MRGGIYVTTLIALLCAAQRLPADSPVAEEESAQERDARMEWWREARFGMFIHWGVYSVPAGTYRGRRIGGIGEWIMNSGKIPVAEYKEFAERFNPVKYDADAWVRLAKEAGMKYIVITSKHHDGFALFDSKVTDWDVVDATPYKKDLLKDLAEACRKHGLRLGFYYSQAQDWCHPGGAAAGGHWDPAQDGDMDEYIQKVAAPQVREILSNYGPIAILWWDTPVGMTEERAKRLLPLVGLQPGIITNNRLGGGFAGDTDTPEQHIPATGIPGRDWETCMTMNDTWGYKSYDDNWKSTEILIRNLVDIASKGGNYLLNVGPTSEGLIPDPSIERLREVGRWMRTNGKAIYATTASPFKRLSWGRSTKKISGEGGVLYLHVFDWPADGRLLLPGLQSEVTSADLLLTDGTKPLSVERSEEGLIVRVPPEAPDPICSVIECAFKGALKVEPVALRQSKDGSITLPAFEATLHGGTIRYESGGDRDNIGWWTDPGDWAEWSFQVSQPGEFQIIAVTATLAPASYRLQIGERTLDCRTVATGDYVRFREDVVGTVEVPREGKTTLQVRAVREGWQPFNLRSIVLRPKS